MGGRRTQGQGEIDWQSALDATEQIIASANFTILFEKGPVMPVFHYTEILISRIECLQRLGRFAEASEIYEQLTGKTLEASSLDPILELCLSEMNREGVSFLALKRFERALDSLQIWEHQLLLPVPLQMLNINPKKTPMEEKSYFEVYDVFLSRWFNFRSSQITCLIVLL